MKKKKTISKEDFLNYLRSEKGKARHIVEREALSDPFMEEALEGFEEWNNPSASLNAVDELDKKIKPAENKWRMIGAAAAVILMLGLTLFWVKDLSKETSELAVKSVEQPSGGLSVDSNVKADELFNKQTVPSDAYIEVDKAKDKGSVTIQEELSVSKQGPGANGNTYLYSTDLYRDGTDDVPAEANKDGLFFSNSSNAAVAPLADSISLSGWMEKEETQKDEASPTSGYTANDKPKEVVAERKIKAKKSDTQFKKESRTPASTADYDDSKRNVTRGESVSAAEEDQNTLSYKLTEAKRLYESKEFKKSLNAYAVILSENPTSEEALYYSGLNQRQLGDPENAVKSFQKVTKKSFFYYNSRWNMYELLTSDPVRSRAILSELASEPNEYQDKAKKLLNP